MLGVGGGGGGVGRGSRVVLILLAHPFKLHLTESKLVALDVWTACSPSSETMTFTTLILSRL